ncbi:hypothetical protein ACLESD_26600 [Pyxidicoccus sp. 3LFB2]
MTSMTASRRALASPALRRAASRSRTERCWARPHARASRPVVRSTIVAGVRTRASGLSAPTRQLTQAMSAARAVAPRTASSN